MRRTSTSLLPLVVNAFPYEVAAEERHRPTIAVLGIYRPLDAKVGKKSKPQETEACCYNQQGK
jgi:hypothetical protein